MTSRLSAKRASAAASGTTITAPGRSMAWAQNEAPRSVSRTGRPTFDLNHWRSASTKLTAAIGVPASWAAMMAMSSKLASASVSSTS